MIPLRFSGFALIFAAFAFWLSWWLMPGVGLFDAGIILDRVSQHRASVVASVILQLGSAAAFAPAMLGVARLAEQIGSGWLLAAAALLLVGAMGSASDAIFHLLAYEMTAPTETIAAMTPLMERMQADGPPALGFMIAAFFAGTLALAWGLARSEIAPRASFWIAALGLVALPSAQWLPAGSDWHRTIGLTALAAVSASLAWGGWAIARQRASPPTRGAASSPPGAGAC